MRPHGRARISRLNPRAKGVCDRCGFHYNLENLQWQYQWVGPRLQSLGALVCDTCLDVPQEQLRTIVLPPDPVAVKNARPENYQNADNPDSTIGGNALPSLTAGSNIGTLSQWGGLPAAFNGSLYKTSRVCAVKVVSDSSFGNWVGINWGGDPSGVGVPTHLASYGITHIVSSFTAYAPSNVSFSSAGAVDYVVQGSTQNSSVYSDWTTISSGTTAGTRGETISGTPSGGAYQFHRIAFQGDGSTPIYVAQVQFSVADVGTFVSTAIQTISGI